MPTMIKAANRVDSFNFEKFSNEVVSAIDNKANSLVIDLAETQFLSFQAIKFLTRTAQLLKGRQGELILRSPCDRIQKHLEVFTDLKWFSIWQETPKERELDGNAYF